MNRYLVISACALCPLLAGFAPAPMFPRPERDPDRLMARFERDTREAAPEDRRPALASRQRRLLDLLARREADLRRRGRSGDADALSDRVRLLETVDGARPLGHTTAAALLDRASVGGSYGKLLRVLYLPADESTCGQFQNYGHWAGTSWGGETDLPPGYWVYVYPRWFVWGETSGR